jgi:hypothetical protein
VRAAVDAKFDEFFFHEVAFGPWPLAISSTSTQQANGQELKAKGSLSVAEICLRGIRVMLYA